MQEFVHGTDEQFKNLKEMLNDNMLHIYKNCRLPQCCSRSATRLGFEKSNGMYLFYVDSGITCSTSKKGNTITQFKQLLSNGEIAFLDFNDLKTFIKALSILY